MKLFKLKISVPPVISEISIPHSKHKFLPQTKRAGAGAATGNILSEENGEIGAQHL